VVKASPSLKARKTKINKLGGVNMKLFNRREKRLRASNREVRFNDIQEEIEVAKDRFYFTMHGFMR